MFYFRFFVIALVFAFMAQPLVLADARAHANKGQNEMGAVHLSIESDAVHGDDHHSNPQQAHEHKGDVCCTVSGVCVALLVECFRTFDFVSVGLTDVSFVQTLTARTVDTLLQPPKIVF